MFDQAHAPSPKLIDHDEGRVAPALAERLRLRSGHLWQTESFDRVVRESSELARTRRYIAGNPDKLRPGTFALKQMNWLDEFAPPPPIDFPT